MKKSHLALIAAVLAGCASLPTLWESQQSQLRARSAVGGNRVTPLVCAEEVYPAMERLIESASESIQFETYLFGGTVGHRLGDRLLAKKKAGVKVQLVLDPGMGSIGTSHKQMTEIVDSLRKEGMEVLCLPVDKLPRGGSWMARKRRIDHAKLVVADGQRAMIGGMNSYDDAAKARDYMMLVEGPAAAKYGEMVQEDFLAAGGKGTLKFNPRSVGDEAVYVGDNGLTNRTIKSVLLDAINGAQKRVWVEMLLLDHDDVINALIAAEKRGVDVRVILDKSAVKEVLGVIGKKLPLEGITNLATVKQLFDAKVPVRWYEPNDRYSYLHAKMMVVDDIALTGSANYTFQALDLNREALARTTAKDVVTRFAGSFQSDWTTNSEEITSFTPTQRAFAAIYDKVRRLIYPVEERVDGDPSISTDVLAIPTLELGL